MGRQRLFVLVHETWNKVQPHPFAGAQPKHSLTPSSSCTIPGRCWKPVLPRVLGVRRVRGSTGRSISTSPGSWATAEWLTASPKTVDAQILSPLFQVIFRRHMRKPFRDLRKLGDTSVSSGFSPNPENKAVVNRASSPALPYHERRKVHWSQGGASHLGLGDSGVRVVPQFSVGCQGVSRSVGLPACCSAWDGCSHASWVWTPTGRARFSLQILATIFFVEPLCCPHHCHFVLCRWWCVVPLFLWARVGQVLIDVSTCVARDL